MYSFAMEDDERILKKTLASYFVDEHAFQGAFYLTNSRLVFVGYYIDSNTKYTSSIQLEHIQELVPGRTMFVIPNAITIKTVQNTSAKVLLQSRDAWLSEIKKQMDTL